MNYFIAISFFFTIANGPTQDSSDVARFKVFVKSYFAAVGKGDTVFLKTYTAFPIKNSDFGSYISIGNNMPSISPKVYFSHLKVFYKPLEISTALKDGDYQKELHMDNSYMLRLERPLKSDPDYLETFTWFFKKQGNDFMFSTFRHEVN
jgi:hypothetical protein